MTRWQLIQELFDATADLGAADRARVLRERADADPELIRQVEALVETDGSAPDLFDCAAGELLERIAVETQGESDEESPEDLCGERFGPYLVTGHISSGGMGHVYEAVRTTAEIERRVAIKVLRNGLVQPGFLERFQRERATLATLQHENIVDFLDAGALRDRRPYLVMEFVEGVPVTRWVAEGEVPPRDRIEMFLRVLSAVQCAHNNLIVHLDLKPSNVLVNADGAPKLLDFGIASVLDADASKHEEPPTGEIGDSRVPMTPSYASPEHLRGEPISTASDVYSLGILLREVMASGASHRPLGADLSAIIARATAADPARRYASVDRLADDLRRHLEGEPVIARSGGFRYRTSCFVRRHRWPVLSAIAVMLALITGWVASDMNRRRAERESSLGWGAHAQARVVSRIMEELVTSAAAEDEALADAAVSQLESAVANRLSELPEAEALARIALGRLYLQRGDLERARPHVERALFLCRTERGLGRGDLRRASELRDEMRGAGNATGNR